MPSSRRLATALCAVLALAACEPERHARPSATPTLSPTPLPTLSPVPVRTPADLAVAPSAGPVATAAGVARVLAGPLSVAALGARVDAMVLDVTSGATLYDRGANVGAVPASTTKVFTAAAALQQLGPDHRLETRVVAAGPVVNGTLRGDLVVVGGGDPTLTAVDGPVSYPQPARLVDLARRVKAAGVVTVTGALVVDTSLFTTPGLGPGWKASYVTEGSVAPISAFLVDDGKISADDDKRSGVPDLTGAAKLRDALRKAGVHVGNVLRRGRAPATATPLASVTSPPVSALVERMLQRSENELAEALARHVAIARRGRTDFAGASAAVAGALRDIGLDAPALVDASGLSRLDRVTPHQLVTLLALAPRTAALAPLLSGLPVAGFSGTLATRYDRGIALAAAGLVRAKTGSLDNVATLAGLVQTRSGRLLVFAFAADRLPTRFVSAAARALDVAAATLAGCGCG